MDIIRKDATITNTDEQFPGSFEVVLSAPTLDRDGDTLLPDEWKTPLPGKITFDSDHGMSVATTVGSGVPELDPESGNLIVRGTYSSLDRAQEVRTLVNEGHITTTSVAFMTLPKAHKDAKPLRELLNGAFVAVPSNREALVLSSKGLKAGARNSASDAEHIQAIHDHAVALGAKPGAGKASKALDRKEPANDPAVDKSPKELALAVDAAVDQALALLDGTDLTALPEEVQRAIALVQTADAASDDLLDALGVPDPDEDAASGASVTPAAGASAPAAGAKGAPVDDAESIAKQAQEARMRFYRTLSER